ncbi:MAG: hypothetical protein WC412_00180 [Candidatus Omnitrophota bacterium]
MINNQVPRYNNPTGIGLPIPLKEGPNQTITNNQISITKQYCLVIGDWNLYIVCILSLGYWLFL